MTTTEILEEAKEKIQDAMALLKKAKKNESLSDYYGYTIGLMIQELDKVSENQAGYLTRDKNIQDILEVEGEKWTSINHK